MSKVFIGMTAYNGDRFIRQAIESLLNQSFSDLVLFISDDASTDATARICLEYANKDKRIVYHRQEKNIGMFPNFKFGLDRANTPYFMLASQDDLWEKDFIQTCIENIEKRNVDVAMTVVAAVDSYGRSTREVPDMVALSGKPGIRQVAGFTLQPEVLGKCNLMYSLFKRDVIREAWKLYPMRKEWGTDYHFALAIVSHFKVYVDEKVLFKKRHGGITSPDALKNDRENEVKRLVITDPKNHMFPFGRFQQYFRGHMEALTGTPYQPLVALLLLIRLPRAFFIHMKQRNLKKFLRRLFFSK